MRICFLLLFAAVLLLGTDFAFANGFLIPGGPTGQDGTVTIAADSQNPPDPTTFELNLSIALEPNRSYACTIACAAPLFCDLDFISVRDPSTNSVNAFTIGDVTPAVPAETADSADNRIAIIPSGTGTQVAGRYFMSIANDTVDFSSNSTSTNGRVDCVETTLYGGYNTNVNDFNFLEILNITNSPVVGAITATNADGTVVINQQVFSVQPNRRADIDIHSAAGPNKFGLIQVVHTGPYGALQAYVSQYDGNINNFVLTSTSQLNPRDK